MKRNMVLELFLIVSVASIWISGAFAMQQYMNVYNTTYTNATCSICHVNPAGGGTLTSYGMNFTNQPNYNDVAGGGTKAALIAIGKALTVTPGATTTATSTAKSTATSNATSTATVTATATLITTPSPFNATPAPTAAKTPVKTPVITTPVPTPTPKTPGFGLGVFTAGLLACYFLLKRRN